MKPPRFGKGLWLLALYGCQPTEQVPRQASEDAPFVCPADAWLEQCASQVFRGENPDTPLPLALSGSLEALEGERLRSGLTCPRTRAELGACLANARMARFEQQLTALNARETRADDPVRAPRLDTFPLAANRWLDRFAPPEIPRDAFQSWYFDSTRPDVVVKSGIVPGIVVNYAWDQGDGFRLPSENFAGYWVGSVRAAADGEHVLAVSQSWADVRVVLDGRKLPNEEEVRVWLDAGYHQLEVEFLNNWHTTDFAVSLRPAFREYSLAEARALLQPLEASAEVWYAGVYESSSPDHSIRLALSAAAPTDVVLVLSSYSQVDWRLAADASIDLKAVVVNSFEPGTLVSSPGGVGVLLPLRRGQLEATYTLETDCHDVGAVFHCEHFHELRKLDDSVRRLTARPVVAFAGEYGAAALSLPTRRLDAAERARLEQESVSVEQARQNSLRQQNPEALFSR
jgi:hypothetical protein